MTMTATAITAPTMSQILPVRLLQSTTREASSLPSHLARLAVAAREVGDAGVGLTRQVPGGG
jgi:hypothetical protein